MMINEIAKPKKYECARHGQHAAIMAIAFFTEPMTQPPTLKEQHLFCIHCVVEKYKEIGVENMKEIKDAAPKQD